MKVGGFLLGMTLLSTITTAQEFQCRFDGYKPIEGLHAGMNRGTLEMAWQGEAGQRLRALFSIHDGHPVVRQLAGKFKTNSSLIEPGDIRAKQRL